MADDRDDHGLPDAYLTIYSKLQAAKALAPSPQRKQLLQALYNMGSALLKAQAIPMSSAVPLTAEPLVEQPREQEDEQQATAQGTEQRAYARQQLAPCVATDATAGPATQATSMVDHIRLGSNPQSLSTTMSDQMPSVTAAMVLLGEGH
jgi:hypothetical protein